MVSTYVDTVGARAGARGAGLCKKLICANGINNVPSIIAPSDHRAGSLSCMHHTKQHTFSFANAAARRFFIFCIAFLLNLPLFFTFAQELDQLLEQSVEEGITVDLREPVYSEGILSTQKGGLINAPQLRIQALHLSYTHLQTPTGLVWTIEAEGDLSVEFGEYVFVGEKLFYDLSKKEGVITWGKTAVEPWFFGGEKLEFRPDGSYIITNGYVTTSENDQPDWGIYSDVVTVDKERYLKARKVYVRAFDYTVFWIPSLRANLDSIFDNPIQYRFRWGARQGPRFGFDL